MSYDVFFVFLQFACCWGDHTHHPPLGCLGLFGRRETAAVLERGAESRVAGAPLAARLSLHVLCARVSQYCTHVLSSLNPFRRFCHRTRTGHSVLMTSAQLASYLILCIPEAISLHLFSRNGNLQTYKSASVREYTYMHW